MQNLWNKQEATQYNTDPLGQCVYASRLLGRNAALVLHGGGNTSVKIKEPDVFGDVTDILYVKGSGSRLETMDRAGFTPLRLQPLARLCTRETLTDEQWENTVKSNVMVAHAPSPSVEALLHAILPHTFVFHTHPDALLAVTSTPSGLERVHEIYGNSVVVVPYTRSGFPIARLCAERIAAELHENSVGMVLMNHGLFTFGETAQKAYDRTIELVSHAEHYLALHNAWHIELPAAVSVSSPAAAQRVELAALRKQLSTVAGFPLIVATRTDPLALAFMQRDDVVHISQQGPATPDHVIRTKNKPLLGVEHVSAYRDAYVRYFETYASHAERELTMLDPAPRVILDPKYGMLTTGRTAMDAHIAGDIYHQTMEIIWRATQLDSYQALTEEQMFNVEYWALEQAKLFMQRTTSEFVGEVVLVTGAASGIGKACAESFLARGTAVVGLDINPAITMLFANENFLGVQCDITSEEALCDALEQTVKTFGGLDMLVLNAGIFPGGRRIDELSTAEWRKVMNINLDANLVLMREAYPLLRQAPRYGRVVVIGSKNVPAPGPGAVSYSASKAALNQLARVAALEWGNDGIRINSMHPNAVFDTGLWTDEVLQARAKHYGLTVEQYKTNNVLHVEVKSRHVAELAVAMCSSLFEPITGSQVPVDGGNDRVI